VLLLVLAAPTAAESPAAEEQVPPTSPWVPPLQIGSKSRASSQVGTLLAEGPRRAYLSRDEDRRFLAATAGLLGLASDGPLAALGTLGYPVRHSWDPVEDKKGLPRTPDNINPKTPEAQRHFEQQLGEFLALSDALDKAYMFKAPQFAAVSKPADREELLARPRRNRGEVVHVEGTIRRLERADPPASVQVNGVRDMYEAWLFEGEEEGGHAWYLLFTELPEGLKPSGENKMNVPAKFDGYFFKSLGYRNKNQQELTAPVLIGNSPVVTGPAEDESNLPAAFRELTGVLMYGILAVVILILVLTAALTWWFRRGDAEVKRRLREIQSRRFVDPGEVPPPASPDEVEGPPGEPPFGLPPS
jgi:hypothetical protein